MPAATVQRAAPAAVIGIDVGGTKVALGVVGAGGEVGERRRIDNCEAPDPRALLDRVAAATLELAAVLDAPGRAVGVGICELVDRDGDIRSATSIPWTRADLVEALSPAGTVSVDADVRVAALAEARVGVGRGFGSFVYVSAGTGVSHCLVREGHPEPGAHGFAQLIGSAPVTIPCDETGGLVTVAVEDVAAGPAIASRYAGRTGRALSTRDVLMHATKGDRAAAAVVDEAVAVLGSFVALLVNVLDPEAVVIGGGLGCAGGAFWDALERRVREHVWAQDARSLPIVPAALGADAGVVGAGLLAMSLRLQGAGG